MDTTLNTIAGIAMALMTGCATVVSTDPAIAQSWQHVCYPAFHQDVAFLAGKAAIDCGFLQLGLPESAKQQIADCATRAAKSGQAFKFGYRGMGDDSWFCDTAIRDADGQLYSLYFDSDITGQGSQENSSLSLSRCNSIEMHPGTISPNSFFELSQCSVARDKAAELVKARGRKP